MQIINGDEPRAIAIIMPAHGSNSVVNMDNEIERIWHKKFALDEIDINGLGTNCSWAWNSPQAFIHVQWWRNGHELVAAQLLSKLCCPIGEGLFSLLTNWPSVGRDALACGIPHDMLCDDKNLAFTRMRKLNTLICETFVRLQLISFSTQFMRIYR